jgi:hypothetical protein
MATHEAKPMPPANGCGHDLDGFLRGGLPRDAVRALVRHLLTGCPACREVGRRAWELSEGEEPYMEQINAAQEQLWEIVDELESLRFRLLGVQASLPEPAADPTPQGLEKDLETMDRRTEIRAVIGCVLNDFVASAIGDLRDVAALPDSEAAEESA